MLETFSRDLERSGATSATWHELGVGAALPFQGSSLVAESLGQGKALYPGLDLRISLKVYIRSEQRQSRHMVGRMG